VSTLVAPGERRVTVADRPAEPRILTFCSIFPNRAEPRHGLFVQARTLALARLAELQVMAPVPASPPVAGLPERYYRCADVPAVEQVGDVLVHHPRFVAIPRILKGTDPALMALSCLPAVLRLRRRFAFDLIDAHWACPDGVAAAYLARMIGVPYSITVRGDDINIFAHEPARRGPIQTALRRADRVIALSTELRDQVVALGASPDRVAVIPNGIDAGRFYPMPREQARASLDIPADGRMLVTVGRLHASKGFPVLVDALAKLGADAADVRLVIVGEPDSEADARPGILAAMASHGLTARVHMVGGKSPEQLRAYYSAADLFCLATTREGSANVLLEAMACGTPCITTDVGGNPDAIPDGRYGILTQTDAEAMAVAIGEGLRRAWDRTAIQARAASRDWNVVAHECYAHLRGLTAPREAAA
jgi:glycosyltransferase involved in cell wall biosynthesis